MEILIRTPLLTLTRFQTAPGHPSFKKSGPVQVPLIAFPRTSVRLQLLGREPFIATPNDAVLLQPGEEYLRFAVNLRGEVSDGFALGSTVLSAFRLSHVSCDRWTYLLQRVIVRYVEESEDPDPLLVEEAALRVAKRLLQSSAEPSPYPVRTRRGQREIAERVKAVLGARFAENLSLAELARAVSVSPFHLCRVFRVCTGDSIHSFRNRLRLRSALETIAKAGETLTEAGLWLGYSSHAHFTTSFHRYYGMAPKELRRVPTAGVVRMLMERLEIKSGGSA